MRIVSELEVKDFLERWALGEYSDDDENKENFFLEIWNWLKEENPLLYHIMKKTEGFLDSRGQYWNAGIIYPMLQILYLLKPIPLVTTLAQRFAEQENKEFGSEDEALVEETKRFKKENPHLYDIGLFILSLSQEDDWSRNEIVKALMKCLRLIRIQEQIDKKELT